MACYNDRAIARTALVGQFVAAADSDQNTARLTRNFWNRILAAGPDGI